MKTELNNVLFYIVVFKRNIIFSSETFRKAELTQCRYTKVERSVSNPWANSDDINGYSSSK